MHTCPRCGATYADGSRYCAADGGQLVSTHFDVHGGETSPEIGQVLGNYRVVEVLGEGGMGRVFIAEHTQLGRRVALKILRSEYAGNRIAVRRFLAEARAVNQISNEHIVEVTDLVETEAGKSYTIMELLSGADLGRVMGGRPMPVGRTVHIARQVCDALRAAHEQKIVHRDLKPDNVFLTERRGDPDFVKVLDFGIAKLADRDQQTEKTAFGAVLGTLEYMAPEQARGAVVDQRADIYAFGVLVYEMLTSVRPFRASTLGELVIQQMTTAPARPSAVQDAAGIPRELDDLVMACIERDPEQRPQTIQEVEERLRAFEPPKEAASRSESVPRRRWRWRIGWPAMVGAGLLAVAAGLAIVAVLRIADRPVAPASEVVVAPAPAPAPAPEVVAPPVPTPAPSRIASVPLPAPLPPPAPPVAAPRPVVAAVKRAVPRLPAKAAGVAKPDVVAAPPAPEVAENTTTAIAEPSSPVAPPAPAPRPAPSSTPAVVAVPIAPPAAPEQKPAPKPKKLERGELVDPWVPEE